MYTDGVAGTDSSAMNVAIDQSDVTFLLTSDSQVKQVDGFNSVRISFASNQSQKLSAATEFRLTNLASAHASDLIDSLQAAHADVVDSPGVREYQCSPERAQRFDRRTGSESPRNAADYGDT